jgi:hypothetical protein
VFLGIVDALRDLGTLDGRHLLELGPELLEAVAGQVGGLVVHGGRTPRYQLLDRCGTERAWIRKELQAAAGLPACLKFDRTRMVVG